MLRADEPIRVSGDVQRTCRDCEREFTITVREQQWFAERDMTLPRRCVECRREVRRARNYQASRDH